MITASHFSQPAESPSHAARWAARMSSALGIRSSHPRTLDGPDDAAVHDLDAFGAQPRRLLADVPCPQVTVRGDHPPPVRTAVAPSEEGADGAVPPRVAGFERHPPVRHDLALVEPLQHRGRGTIEVVRRGRVAHGIASSRGTWARASR